MSNLFDALMLITPPINDWPALLDQALFAKSDFMIEPVSKGLDMKGDSGKIVSTGGWGAAGMMHNSFHCVKS